MNVQIDEAGWVNVELRPEEAEVVASVLGRVIDNTDSQAAYRLYTLLLDNGISAEKPVEDTESFNLNDEAEVSLSVSDG